MQRFFCSNYLLPQCQKDTGRNEPLILNILDWELGKVPVSAHQSATEWLKTPADLYGLCRKTVLFLSFLPSSTSAEMNGFSPAAFTAVAILKIQRQHLFPEVLSLVVRTVHRPGLWSSFCALSTNYNFPWGDQDEIRPKLLLWEAITCSIWNHFLL